MWHYRLKFHSPGTLEIDFGMKNFPFEMLPRYSVVLVSVKKKKKEREIKRIDMEPLKKLAAFPRRSLEKTCPLPPLGGCILDNNFMFCSLFCECTFSVLKNLLCRIELKEFRTSSL